MLCDTLEGVFWWVFVVKNGPFIEYTSEKGTPVIEHTIPMIIGQPLYIDTNFCKISGKVSVSQDLYHKEKRFQWEAKISVPGQRKKVVSNHNGTTILFRYPM